MEFENYFTIKVLNFKNPAYFYSLHLFLIYFYSGRPNIKTPKVNPQLNSLVPTHNSGSD